MSRIALHLALQTNTETVRVKVDRQKKIINAQKCVTEIEKLISKAITSTVR